MPIFKRFAKSSFNEAIAAVRGGPPSSAFYTLPTPDELRAVYEGGYQGIRPDSTTPESKAAFKTFMAAQPRLYDAFPWAKGLGKGKVSCPYLAAQKLIAGWGPDHPQVQGDCTVHSTAHAAEIDYANDCLWGETAFKGHIAFENIYRSRGFNGDGWSCEAPAMYIGKEGKGGMLYRKVYEGPGGEKVDLSRYNSSWQSNGRAGVPEWLAAESRKNKAKWIILITTMEEYRDALALAFGISVCSGQGYASTTDEFGVAAAQGSWSHAMANTACVDTEWAHSKYGDMIGGIQNSWGEFNRQKGKPEGAPAMPGGMFYSRASVLARMLRGEDSYAICGVWGWDRTGWEAFDTTELVSHLNNSTTQDYYKTRAERSAEFVVQALDEGFLAI